MLADEPTGNLDLKTTREALELMREACRESGAGLLVASHDRDALEKFEDVRELSDINRSGDGQRVG